MYRFGIIGTGAIAAHHAKSIGELKDCELVAVCSSTNERAKKAAEKFGVSAYSNIDNLLANESIDIVCICTQSGKHMEPIITAAMAGKHIISEKPLEINLERANRIVSVCRSHGVKLSVIFQNRFNPSYIKLKNTVENGSLGKLILGNAYIKWYRDTDYYGNSNWKGTLIGDGGAALINQGIHTIDLLLDIMQDAQSVFGKVKTMVHDIEGEDVGVAIVNFKNGAMGTIEGGTSLYPGYKERLEIYGENGSIIYEGGKILKWHVKGEEDLEPEFTTNSSSGSANPLEVDYRLHKEQIRDMVEAIKYNREPLVNGEKAIKSLQLIAGIYRSSREEKMVKLE